MIYPSAERQNVGYAIRYIKAILASDAIRDVGADSVLLCIFIASCEDKLHYAKPPMYWRSQLMDRFGKCSPNSFNRIRDAAVTTGLLYHIEGTRTTPGQYWTLVPKWLLPQFEPYQKLSASSLNRIKNDTANDTANGALPIPSTQYPVQSNVASLDAHFETFWKAYPPRDGRKLNKQDAIKAFGRIQSQDIPDVMRAVNALVASQQIPKDAHRFLAQDRWREWLQPLFATRAAASRPNESDRIPRRVSK